nr:uncharacterized protein LOC109147547 [Ipomoea batatas]
MNALSARHVEVDDLCPLCRLNPESLGHLFYGCMHVAPLWNDFIDYPPPGATADFMTWFSNLFVNGSLAVRLKFAALCWSIWHGRNDLVWNQTPWQKDRKDSTCNNNVDCRSSQEKDQVRDIFWTIWKRKDDLTDESLKNVTSVLRKMDDTVVEFAEVIAEIGNTRTRGGIIKKTLSSPQPAPTIDVPTATEQQQDQSITIELQNITRDLQEDSEKTISNGEQLDTTITYNIQKELFDSEELFEYDGYYLSRDNFQSMRAGELESIFIDIWCLRLNHLDLNRGVDKPKRIFFSTQDFAKDDDSGHNTNQQDFGQCLDTEINNVANFDISNAQLAPPKRAKNSTKVW